MRIFFLNISDIDSDNTNIVWQFYLKYFLKEVESWPANSIEPYQTA